MEYCVIISGLVGAKPMEVEFTPPTIQDHGNKRIAIPRKKPTKILRKPVFSYEPHTEIAVMSTAMVLLNSLGVFLYWLVHCFIFIDITINLCFKSFLFTHYSDLSPGQTITTFQRDISQDRWPSICNPGKTITTFRRNVILQL